MFILDDFNFLVSLTKLKQCFSEQDDHQTTHGLIEGVGINNPKMALFAADFDIPVADDGFLQNSRKRASPEAWLAKTDTSRLRS